MSGIRMLGLYLVPLFLFLLPSMLLAEENIVNTVETEAAKAETVVAETAKAESVVEEKAVEQPPLDTAPTQAVPAEEKTPEKAPVDIVQEIDEPEGVSIVSEKVEEVEETTEEVTEEPKMPKSWSMVVVSNRTTFGMLGSRLVAEYGFQVEMTSKKFGIRAHWANFQPYPDNVGFCWDLGFAFHYYPFGDGPSGLYAGPGFMFVQMFQNPDPMRMVQTELRKRLARENLANTEATGDYRLPPMDIADMGLIINYRTGYGHQFNLLVPQLEVGYRHRWPQDDASVYFIVGIEATLGVAVSDVVNFWGHDFMWTLNPQLGLGF